MDAIISRDATEMESTGILAAWRGCRDRRDCRSHGSVLVTQTIAGRRSRRIGDDHPPFRSDRHQGAAQARGQRRLPDQAPRRRENCPVQVTDQPLGRERKKLKTHRAVRREASRLFDANGYAATTVEQIADG